MRIGLDFDNTIVCYEEAIEVLANRLFDLPPEVIRTKVGLRNFLRTSGREHEWTAFQGELYGPGMSIAKPFFGAIDTMHQLKANGHDLVIVSHRSLRPYAGKPHDLHAAALCWVSRQLHPAGLFLPKSHQYATSDSVHFLESQDQKLAKIAELRCDVFVDDLPEVLSSPYFPDSTIGILFDSAGSFSDDIKHLSILTWDQLPRLLRNVL